MKELLTVAGMHRLLYVCNGFVIFVLMALMCLTQERINQSITARAFLESAGAVPQSSTVIFCTTTLAFLTFVLVGHFYRKIKKRRVKYFLFAAEIVICMFLMRVLNLSYDGIVLLVVADLMYKYEGHRQEYTLLVAMICLYFIANYNLAIFQTKIISFEAYAIEVAQMAETRERNRLAREIHDTLGHALTGITDVRRSVKKLRPDDLERLPFQEALMEMTKDYSESSGMEITFDIFSWSDKLRRDQEDVIYRVLQESITKAKRHRQATKVKITIGGNEKYLLIVIADNGRGCEDVKQGFGLAENGNKVLELLRKNLPDIIFMDIRMPELDGVLCTKIVKEKFLDVKIIILTTFDDDEYVFYALKYGASGYLLKGCSVHELTSAIHTVMNGGSTLNAGIITKIVKLFNRLAPNEYHNEA